jgi:hypothetical protein
MGMLVIVKDWEVLQDTKEMELSHCKHRQNPRGKPGSVCSPSDTRR